jgi:hypothetical protein
MSGYAAALEETETDAQEEEEEEGEAEYVFEGFHVEFSEKIALLPQGAGKK